MHAILNLLRSARPSKGRFRERRKAPRFPVVENRGCLSWWDGDDCIVVPTRMENLSALGALLLLETPPPVGQPLWLRMEEPIATGWIEVGLAWANESGAAGVYFPSTCPYELYRKLAIGPEAGSTDEEAAGTQFEGR
jgi:hypothetical protein